MLCIAWESLWGQSKFSLRNTKEMGSWVISVYLWRNPKKKHMVYGGPMPELNITSPYVHCRVDSQHIYHGQPCARVDRNRSRSRRCQRRPMLKVKLCSLFVPWSAAFPVPKVRLNNSRCAILKTCCWKTRPWRFVPSSVVDPWHFGTDPDPRIHTTCFLIWILLFSLVAF